MDAQLRGLLLQTTNPNVDLIRQAEQVLRNLECTSPDFAKALLAIVQANDAAAMPAAILFKNYIGRNWKPDSEMRLCSVDEASREHIKSMLIGLMCSSPPATQRQLSEAVRIVAENDWPEKWQSLIPMLVGRISLDPSQLHTLLGILATLNEIFKRFRDVPPSDPLFLQLKYALDTFGQQPLLSLFAEATKMAHAQPPLPQEELRQLYLALRLMARIFYSLNWQTIPEFFEDNIATWMDLLHSFLVLNSAPLPATSEEEAQPVERLQTAVLQIARIYAEKYGEEFEPQLARFAGATFQLLVGGSQSPQPRYDELVTTGMGFIATLVCQARNRALFQAPNVLAQICQLIVIPNLNLRRSDVEAFEDNPLEFLRRDIEGSDAETRRRVACDLVEKMTRLFDNEVTALCAAAHQSLMARYAANPAGEWAAKDAAVTLVIAIMQRGSTLRDGCTVCKDVGAVLDFLSRHVLPELSKSDLDADPILKADSIKYIATFRLHIPLDLVRGTIIPLLVRALEAKSQVVHTYAAACLEGIMAVREPNTSTFRYDAETIAPHVETVLLRLFTLIETRGDNEYLIKCVLRVLGISRQRIAPVVPALLQKFALILQRVISNPANPTFNHTLFDCIAATVKFAVMAGRSPDELEQTLNPMFERILSTFNLDFMPYVFQIMAQLLTLRSTVPPHYMQIFNLLLTPQLWEARANVPALVGLLEAYMAKGASQVLTSDPKTLESLLAVFQRLLQFRSTEDSSLELLQSIVSFCPLDLLKPHLPGLVRISLERLQQSQSILLAQALVVFLAVLCGRSGPSAFTSVMDAIAPGAGMHILKDVWIPTMGKARGNAARKAVAVGTTRLLCEWSALAQQPELWSSLLSAQVALLSEWTDVRPEESDALVLQRLEEAGQSDQFQRLFFARDGPPDLFPEVANATGFFTQAITGVVRSMGPDYVLRGLDAKKATLLRGWTGI